MVRQKTSSHKPWKQPQDFTEHQAGTWPVWFHFFTWFRNNFLSTTMPQGAWNDILAIPQPFQSEWLGFQRSKWDCLTIPSIPDTSLTHINKPNLSCKNPKLLLLLCLFFKPQTESAGHGRLKLLCKVHPKREAVTAKEILLRLWLDDWGRLDSGVTVPKCDCCAVEQLFLFKPCEGSL